MDNKQKLNQMIDTPIKKLIPTLAIPTIISMLVTSIYNMADTYFVSQLSTSASGAVGIIFSLMAIIQTVGFTLGMGGGNTISRCLGAKNYEKAEKTASTAFYTSLVLGIIITLLGLLFLEPMVYAFGATDTIAPYAKEYASYILLAAPFMTSSFVLNNLLRSQGNAMYAMVGITIGGILNMILDPLLIFGFNMGIGGAAIATAISQIISFLILYYQVQTKKDNIHIKLTHYSFSFDIHGSILKAGAPTFCRQGIASVASVFMNLAAYPFGDATIAAMSIVTRYMLFINSSLIGFGQGFQPVCGFNYGAHRYDRVLEAFYFCVKVAIILLTGLAIVSYIFAPTILTLFRSDDLAVIQIGTTFLRYQALLLPTQAWIIMVNMLSQSIGYSVRASLVAMGRQGIFLLPALFIFPALWDLVGLQIAQPFADLCSFVLSSVVVISILKQLKQKAIENNQ